jgi:hypothetical protein
LEEDRNDPNFAPTPESSPPSSPMNAWRCSRPLRASPSRPS